jgi:hypothetical protein
LTQASRRSKPDVSAVNPNAPPHPDQLDQALSLATALTWQALAADDTTLSSLA